MWNYGDLYCIGSIRFNQIDLTKKEQEIKKNIHHIYDKNIHDTIGQNLINSLPFYLKNLYQNVICNIKHNDRIPEIIEDNLSKQNYAEFVTIQQDFDNINDYIQIDSNETFAEENLYL